MDTFETHKLFKRKYNGKNVSIIEKFIIFIIVSISSLFYFYIILKSILNYFKI
jgi:hypothetical protein